MSRWRLLALVGVFGLALASCGDDGEADGTDRTSTTVVPTPTSTLPAVTTSTTRSAGAPTTTPMALRCETVGFTPNSEDAASEIRATGLTCDEAEAFVRVVGPRTSSGGPQALNVEGYRCVLTRSVEDPLPQAFYECTDGTRRVTFTRS